jgi:mycothiol synthase
VEPHLEVVADLDDHLRSQVREILARAEQNDGLAPLSEQAVLRLVSSPGPIVHVLALREDRLDGYAQISPADAPDTSTAELVVEPHARGRGIGRRLAEAALAASPDGRLQVWAHGDHPAAGRIADHLGLARVRTL